MIRVCLLMVSGGFVAQLIRLSPGTDLLQVAVLASIVAIFVCRGGEPLFFVLGLLLFLQAGQAVVDNRLQPRFAGDSLLTRVRLVDFPKIAGEAVTMLVEPVDDARLPPRSRISWFSPPVLPEIGDVWEFELRLRRPRGYSNPGVFDVEAWFFREKIHATGYVVNGKRNRRLGSGNDSAIDSLRRGFVARAAAAAATPETGAVVAAIGVGARHRVSREQWQSYAVTGTSHLMAISGLHVGLAASAVFIAARLLLGTLPLSINAQVPALLAGAAAAGAYAVVSGLGVPAGRASLMLAIAALAVVRRRYIDPFAVVAAAAICTFAINPIAAMTPGFGLSFAAVVLLLWLARSRQAFSASRRPLSVGGNVLRQFLAMQLFLFFGLMPLTVLLFQRIALYATPVNLVAVPLFSLVTVPCTLVGLLAGEVFSNVGKPALHMAAASVAWLEALIGWVARLPLADTTVARIQGSGWLLVILPSIWAVLPRRWPGRWIAPLAAVALLLHAPERPGQGCMDVHVLDVGQGLATVVETGREVLLFDTGASYPGGGAVADQVIVPFLKSRKIRRIDWLVVSHADNDHSGGVDAVTDYAVVDRLLSGEPLRGSTRPSSRCHAGQAWQFHGIRARFLHPPATGPGNGNASSCVLLLEAGNHGLLLTGDIEAAAERAIIQNNDFLRVDAVVVPHHGSLTSSSVPFVEALSPRIAVVSAGYQNRWGFPKARVVRRWEQAGAELLNTATSGAISMTLCAAGGLQNVRLDRNERRRFWRDSRP